MLPCAPVATSARSGAAARAAASNAICTDGHSGDNGSLTGSNATSAGSSRCNRPATTAVSARYPGHSAADIEANIRLSFQ